MDRHCEVWHMQCLFIWKLGSIPHVPMSLFPSELRGFKSEKEDMLGKTQIITHPCRNFAHLHSHPHFTFLSLNTEDTGIRWQAKLETYPINNFHKYLCIFGSIQVKHYYNNHWSGNSNKCSKSYIPKGMYLSSFPHPPLSWTSHICTCTCCRCHLGPYGFCFRTGSILLT